MNDEGEAQCIRLWLEGVSRKAIALKLGISEGTVVNYLSKHQHNNSDLTLQRQLALYVKRTGVDVFQLACNTVFHNSVKRLGAKEENLLDFLSDLQKQFDLEGYSQNQVIDALASVSKMIVRVGIKPDKIFQTIHDGYIELEKLNSTLV